MLQLAKPAYPGLADHWQLLNLSTPLTVESVRKVVTQTLGAGSAPEKTLTVTIHSAKNLAAADPNGKSDPYVKFGFVREGKFVIVHKTKHISATLNPTWTAKHKNQATWRIKKESIPNSSFSCEVWDKDMIGADDFLGHAKFNIIYGQDVDDQELDLKPDPRRKGKVSGSIIISLKWT